MANGTLSFQLPEEQVEFDMANKAADMWCILHELDQELRSCLKYNARPEWHENTVEEIRKILLDAMMERGVNFN